MIDTTIEKIRARRAVIAQQRKALDEEDNDLLVTERTIMRLDVSKPAAKRAEKIVRRVSKKQAVKAPVAGNRGRIIGALKQMPGKSAESPVILNNKIEELYGHRINPNSLHPILAALGKSGTIDRDGGRVVLKGD
jgi:hypothetical protein